MRLLVRPRPDVHLSMVEVLALPVEGAVVARPRLHDQVVGFPEPLHHAGRPVIAGRDLVRHAPHEPALEAPPRVHVDHRHLLRHPHGLAAVRDGIAEDEQPRLARVTRERAHHHRRRRVQVRRRLVVLVHHDLEAEVLGDLPFVDEAVIEVGADLGIVVAIRELDADGIVLPGVGQQVIGVLAEEPGAHTRPSYQAAEKDPSAGVRRPRPHAQRTESMPRVRPSGAASQLDLFEQPGSFSASSYSSLSSRNARMRATSASGASRCGKCPAPSIVCRRAPGIASR